MKSEKSSVSQEEANNVIVRDSDDELKMIAYILHDKVS